VDLDLFFQTGFFPVVPRYSASGTLYKTHILLLSAKLEQQGLPHQLDFLSRTQSEYPYTYPIKWCTNLQILNAFRANKQFGLSLCHHI